jgi:hypothetical protein
MDLQNNHELLVAGEDFDTCRRKALHFLTNNMLLRYDTVEVIQEEAVSAESPLFWQRIEQGEAANRQAIKGLFAELRAEGSIAVNDLLGMGQGYKSKIFHIIAHLLDGFFGIDSALYNLADDSHWLADSRRQQILDNPENYWLLKVAASSKGKSPDRLHILRSATEEEE